MVDFPQLVLFDFQGRRTTYMTGCLLSFKDYINEERVFFVVRGNRLNFLLGNVKTSTIISLVIMITPFVKSMC